MMENWTLVCDLDNVIEPTDSIANFGFLENIPLLRTARIQLDKLGE